MKTGESVFSRGISLSDVPGTSDATRMKPMMRNFSSLPGAILTFVS
jgi:hypothetical protein